jgi:hypothetical protein
MRYSFVFHKLIHILVENLRVARGDRKLLASSTPHCNLAPGECLSALVESSWPVKKIKVSRQKYQLVPLSATGFVGNLGMS